MGFSLRTAHLHIPPSTYQYQYSYSYTSTTHVGTNYDYNFFPLQHTKLQPDASPLEIPVSLRCTLCFLFRSRARLSSVSICLSDQVPSKPAENESQASLQVSAPLLPVGLIHHPTRSHYYANPQSASMKSSPIPTT